MARKRPTPPGRKADTKEALVRGALECLRSRGFARTTARDVVAAAGVNLGAIGYHFGSMDALLGEALARAFREWLFRVEPVLSGAREGSFEELLLRVARVAAAVFPEGRQLAAAFLEGVAQSERAPALRQQMADDYEQLRVLTAGLLETTLGDRVPASDRRGLASVFLALDVGFMVQALLDPARAATAEEIVQSLTAFAALFDE